MTVARTAPRKVEIRFLPWRLADVDPLACVPDYRERAAASELPHGPAHDCLICADARAALGYLPLEPVLAARARGMRERADGIPRLGGAG